MENLTRKRMSIQEYFSLEESSQENYEFYHGEIFSMSGASRIHNLIVGNLLFLFKNQFKNKDCEIYSNDMRVQICEQNHYTYPDLTIVCGERTFPDKKETTLVNPTVIIEVLSNSTESYDRGKKFQAYRSIQSLKTYILVSTNYKQIEVFKKTESNLWTLSEPDVYGNLSIPFPNCTLAVTEVYNGVDLNGE
jgi:Uma2 family endonuclease